MRICRNLSYKKNVLISYNSYHSQIQHINIGYCSKSNVIPNGFDTDILKTILLKNYI